MQEPLLNEKQSVVYGIINNLHDLMKIVKNMYLHMIGPFCLIFNESGCKDFQLNLKFERRYN